MITEKIIQAKYLEIQFRKWLIKLPDSLNTSPYLNSMLRKHLTSMNIYQRFLINLKLMLPYFTIVDQNQLYDKIASACVFYFSIIGLGLGCDVQNLDLEILNLYNFAYLISDTAIDNPKINDTERQGLIYKIINAYQSRSITDDQRINILIELINRIEEKRPDLKNIIKTVFLSHLTKALSQNRKDLSENLFEKTKEKGIETIAVVNKIFRIKFSESGKLAAGIIQRIDDMIDIKDDIDEGNYTFAVHLWKETGYIDSEIYSCMKDIIFILDEWKVLGVMYIQFLYYICRTSPYISSELREIVKSLNIEKYNHDIFAPNYIGKMIIEDMQSINL